MEANKRAVSRSDCEIINVEPLSDKVPERAEKGKVVMTVPLKRKGSLRAGSQGLDVSGDLVGNTKTGGKFVSV